MENKDVYFNFLEELRKSGVTNMFGATPYLEAEFEELTHAEAIEILKEWMKDYSELSKRLGWDKSMTPDNPEEQSGEVHSVEDEYIKLFDENIDRDVIDNFLKVLAENELMNELDNAKHIWHIEGLPFVISYEDGRGNLISLVDGKVTVYDKFLDEYCTDFGLNFEDVRQQILDKTGIDFKPSFEDEFEDDSEEAVDYGSDEVIEDEFEEEGE